MRTTSKINAIVLAGDRQASIQVRNDNKAFLPLRGEPLFIHVLHALQNARLVGDVYLARCPGPSGAPRYPSGPEGVAPYPPPMSPTTGSETTSEVLVWVLSSSLAPS